LLCRIRYSRKCSVRKYQREWSPDSSIIWLIGSPRC
jgi:hypothetical protein